MSKIIAILFLFALMVLTLTVFWERSASPLIRHLQEADAAAKGLATAKQEMAPATTPPMIPDPPAEKPVSSEPSEPSLPKPEPPATEPKVYENLTDFLNESLTYEEIRLLAAMHANTNNSARNADGARADNLTPSIFVRLMTVEKKVDAVMQRLDWTYQDSLQAAIQFVNDHPELTQEKKKKTKKR